MTSARTVSTESPAAVTRSPGRRAQNFFNATTPIRTRSGYFTDVYACTRSYCGAEKTHGAALFGEE
jgi:hypothetical protein